MKRLLFSILFISFFFISFAQSPQSFQYQAVVRDVSGLVLPNQSVNIKISLISGILPGTIEYVETHTATTNAFGVVTFAVGNGTPVTNLFSDINWSITPHFLKVEVDPGTGLIDMGTTQLLSVPYALYSENSGNAGDTLWGISGNNIYNKNEGNVGIGINTPPGKLVVQGDSLASATDPLFEVKNKSGQTVFVVYPDSVHFFIKDDMVASNRGGFAVSGRSNAKGLTNDYLKVRPDSTRIWTGDTLTGFGVRNIGATSKTSYMQLTPKNYFIGHEAGKSVTSGRYNSFIGYQAGYKDTSGYKNYFIGYRSGYRNLSGYSNIFIGDSAGFYNTTGIRNVIIGNQSGLNNLTGNYNVFLGYQTGYSNTSGLCNTANGYSAFYSNATGSKNVANGYQALYYDTIGSYNVANGYQALYNNNADYNIANGCEALYFNTSGVYNVAEGFRSLYRNTTGGSNIAIGQASLLYNTTGNFNTANGVISLYSNSTGNSNTALGYGAFFNGSSYSNSTALGANALITVSNKVRLGNTTVTVIEGQVAYTFPSDGRFKNNVTEEVKGLDFITKLRPIVYNFDTKKFDAFLMKDMSDSLREAIMSKKDYSESTSIRQTGFIAQEVEIAAKESGFDFNGVHKPANNGDNYSVSYSLFTVPLVKAVQELNTKNEELQKVIDDIQKENYILKTKVQEIDNLKTEIEKIKKDQLYKQ